MANERSPLTTANAVAGWQKRERLAYLSVAILVCLLTCAYVRYIDREIFHDEPGLFNPIYTFLQTGSLAYPLHGEPQFMTVHPPTHYLLIAGLMKMGLPLYEAAAVPVAALMLVTAASLATGGFAVHVALALLLGSFAANIIWADLFLVRPDLHLTLAWFAGLVTLEGARNRHWSTARLAIGTALCVYAATLHYWGVASLLTPFLYLAALLREGRWHLRVVARQLAAIAAGGLIVAVPFLLWFVVPLWRPMLATIASVQGDGGMVAALQRHTLAYGTLGGRLMDAWAPRPILGTFLLPLLVARIPAVVLSPFLLMIGGARPMFAAAASILPLFVLLASQGKPTGQTLYYTPEITVYLAGVFMCCLRLGSWLYARPRPYSRALAAISGVVLVVGTLTSVPAAAGSNWRWTASLHAMEFSRAAALRLNGKDSLVGMVSLGSWYTAGAQNVWIAANDLTEVNRAGGNVEAYLSVPDAFAIDIDWWHALPDLAPLGQWYVDERLSLAGFVLPTTRSGRDQFTLFVSAHPERPVRGYFLSGSDALEFSADPDGDTAFSVWVCPRTPPAASFSRAFYRHAFSYKSAPALDSPALLMIGSRWSSHAGVTEEAGRLSCHQRDLVRGRTHAVARAALLSELAARDQPIRIATTLSDAVAGWTDRVVGRRNGPETGIEIDWTKASVQGPPGRQPSDGLPVLVTPPAVAWGYGAVIPFQLSKPGDGSLLLTVRALIRGGRAGFGVSTVDERGFVARTFQNASPTAVDVHLFVPRRTPMGPLVVQNAERGDGVEIEVLSISVHEVSASP